MSVVNFWVCLQCILPVWKTKASDCYPSIGPNIEKLSEGGNPIRDQQHSFDCQTASWRTRQLLANAENKWDVLFLSLSESNFLLTFSGTQGIIFGLCRKGIGRLTCRVHHLFLRHPYLRSTTASPLYTTCSLHSGTSILSYSSASVIDTRTSSSNRCSASSRGYCYCSSSRCWLGLGKLGHSSALEDLQISHSYRLCYIPLTGWSHFLVLTLTLSCHSYYRDKKYPLRMHCFGSRPSCLAFWMILKLLFFVVGFYATLHKEFVTKMCDVQGYTDG